MKIKLHWKGGTWFLSIIWGGTTREWINPSLSYCVGVIETEWDKYSHYEDN
jgi:hypothetical protein